MKTLPGLRSMLYAPGSDPHKMRKALSAGADAVIFDLEDAVAEGRKQEARIEVARLLDELAADHAPHPPIFVRINGPSSGALDADLDAAVRPPLSGLKLPKTEGPEELVVVDEACTTLEAKRGMTAGSTVVIPGIESARGVEALDGIARAPRVWCLSFGAVDFAMDLGTEPTAEGVESLVALSSIAIASAAAGLQQPMDSAWSDIGDEDGLRRVAGLARRLGFQGKAVIHPRQVPIVNDVFDISESEVRRARALVRAAGEASTEGRGAIQMAGALVDAAHVKRARAVVDAYERRTREGRTDA